MLEKQAVYAVKPTRRLELWREVLKFAIGKFELQARASYQIGILTKDTVFLVDFIILQNFVRVRS